MSHFFTLFVDVCEYALLLLLLLFIICALNTILQLKPNEKYVNYNGFTFIVHNALILVCGFFVSDIIKAKYFSNYNVLGRKLSIIAISSKLQNLPIWWVIDI